MMRFGKRRSVSFAVTAEGRSGPRRSRGLALLAAAVALLLPAALAAQDSGSASASVTFFTGPNFTGSSKTLTLTPEQPYAAIPVVGDALNEKIASLRADPQVGVILFQRPYFASRDDVCGPNVGTAEDPDAWWLGLTADVEPPYFTDQPYEAPETADDDYSSVIAYRRDLGPPPGFLLLERRSYYNRACERSADQSYFNRIFIPVPNPPQREACTDLSAPASAPGAGADAPRFVRVSDAYALLPEAFSRRYGSIDHRFILTLFDGPGCSGASITLPSSAEGRPASYRLSDYEFDRKVKSVMIRYQRGPLDRYLADAAAPAEATLTPPSPAGPSAAMPSTPPAPEPAPPPMQQAAPPPVPPAAAPQPAPQAPAPQAVPQAAASQPSPQAATPAPQAATPAPVPQEVTPQPASPPPAGGGLQPPPPSAPAQQPQEAPQPVPEQQFVPMPAPAPTPSRPAGPQEETFRFPVFQAYRLNYCLDGDKGCGEPAATAWCKDRGFARALRWTQEDNIGALYPTIFFGSSAVCDKFLCDGFEEITCSH